MKILRYIEAAERLCAHHVVLCDSCNYEFGSNPHPATSVVCPKCLRSEPDVRGMINAWRMRCKAPTFMGVPLVNDPAKWWRAAVSNLDDRERVLWQELNDYVRPKIPDSTTMLTCPSCHLPVPYGRFVDHFHDHAVLKETK